MQCVGWIAAILLMAAQPAAAAIRLGLDDIIGEGWSFRKVVVVLDASQSASLNIGEIRLGKRLWPNLGIRCGRFQMTAQSWRCTDGALELNRRIPIQIEYQPQSGGIRLLLGSASAQLTIQGSIRETLTLQVDGWPLTELAAYLPEHSFNITTGTVTANARWSPNQQLDGEFSIENLAFSNAAGTQAAEKLRVAGKTSGRWQDEQLQWQAQMRWDGGELFWSPLYLAKGDAQAAANGTWQNGRLVISAGQFQWGQHTSATFSGTYRAESNQLESGKISTSATALRNLYADIFQPMLAGTSLGNIELEGRGKVEVEWANGQLQRANLGLEQVNLADRSGRFALYGLGLNLPWQRDDSTTGQLGWTNAELLKIPLGKLETAFALNAQRLTVPKLVIPIADGRLQVAGLYADWSKNPLHWGFSAELTPTNLEALTLAVGATPVPGTLAAVVPEIAGRGGEFELGGAVLLRAFDGTVVIQDLKVSDLFGKAPRLYGRIDAKQLDLGELTRTYSFGNMTGRIDAQIHDLQMVNWLPTEMDLKIVSSAGDYPRKISQRAVENISALGGAGAAAALQRSFLRFFKEFGYSQLGFGCQLVQGVCHMSGVADQTQGYVLVAGSGIPAISVLGYNRRVSWTELIDRLQAAMSGNRAPIIQ